MILFALPPQKLMGSSEYKAHLSCFQAALKLIGLESTGSAKWLLAQNSK